MNVIDRITDAATLVAGRWRWRKATDITSLANLRADRLARQGDQVARSRAKYAQANPDPDREAVWSTMYSTLVALGRAGVVVDNWRPGTAAHGHEYDVEMETRAAVSGFASTEVQVRIENLLYHAGYKTTGAEPDIYFAAFELWAPGCVEYDRWDGDDSARCGGVPVERIDGRPTARIGGQMDPDQIYRAFPTRATVEQELQEAWLITIADKAWGASTLFADLLVLLSEDSHTPA